MKYLLKIFPVASVLFLNACVSLLPEQGRAPQRIWLDPVVETAPIASDSTNVLSVTRPTAATMLASDRLRIRNLKGKIPLIDHIADVEWQEPLPLMIQRHLVQHIQASQAFKAVGFEEDSFDRDRVFDVDIQHFDVVILKERMYADVTLSAKLLDAKGRGIIWQKTFTAKAPLHQHTLVDFIKGLTQAYEDVLAQMTKALG